MNPGVIWMYLLLLFPMAVILWLKIPMAGKLAVAVARMTVQLLLMGVYLQYLFKWNNPWLNAGWLLVMAGVADGSILRSCGLRVRRFCLPLGVALVVGTAIPLVVFALALEADGALLDARSVIPVGGMILGNCLRANILGLKGFYQKLRDEQKRFQLELARGASLREACHAYLRDACRAALEPTLATMGTIGIVSLPGMMTGVLMGGSDPMTAIGYQIGIMIAIFCGTALTVTLAVLMTLRGSFTAAGTLRSDLFRPDGKA